MVKHAEDSRIMEQKDTIRQLNMTINSQNELIASLRSTVDECNSTILGLWEQVEYLTGKLFGTSSEKSKTMEGQLSLFDEAEQEAQPSSGRQGQSLSGSTHVRQNVPVMKFLRVSRPGTK